MCKILRFTQGSPRRRWVTFYNVVWDSSRVQPLRRLINCSEATNISPLIKHEFSTTFNIGRKISCWSRWYSDTVYGSAKSYNCHRDALKAYFHAGPLPTKRPNFLSLFQRCRRREGLEDVMDPPTLKPLRDEILDGLKLMDLLFWRSHKIWDTHLTHFLWITV